MWIIGTARRLDSCARKEDGCLKIRFYGRLGEKLGAEVNVDPPAGTDTIERLRDVLADMFPDASADLRQRSRACVADSIVNESHKLTGADTVEFFPPLSGG
jgi:molybdopterin converting factor small subunit